MNLLIIQAVVCMLISLWGAAMLVIGLVWLNPTWILLGLAVLIVGLPFARNALRSNGSTGGDLFSP
jgi:hypothetical protein